MMALWVHTCTWWAVYYVLYTASDGARKDQGRNGGSVNFQGTLHLS